MTREAGSRRSVGSAGFTLIELLAVMVLIALLAAMVMPGRPSRSPATELREAARQLVQDLRRGRADAVAGNRAVVVAVAPHLPAGASLTVTTTAELSAGGGAIRFAPDGSSSGGGAEMRLGERGWRVNVDWLTGMVTLRPLE